MRQIFLDTETTGLSADGGDRIIEIGCVEMINRKLNGNDKHFYFNPERDSHEDAIRIHGITNESLRDKPFFSAHAQELADYWAGAEVVIHNAPFDVGFLNAEFARVQMPKFGTQVGKVVDSLVMAKNQFPGKRNGLDALCDRFEVDRSTRSFHGALLDAQLLAEVFVRMTRGQDSLMIDAGPQTVGTATSHVDLRGFDLPIVLAEGADLTAHEALLKELDKESGGKTVWTKAAAPALEAAAQAQS
jgi:DNA polymerase III subunit epsilon